MKWLLAALIAILLGLQYRLWVGEGSLAHVSRLETHIAEQEKENHRLRVQNSRLAAEVRALKEGDAAVEAKAREELGLVKKGETFFLFVEEPAKESQ